MSERIEASLHDLGRAIAYPATPDISGNVVPRLPRRRRRSARIWWVAAAALAAAVLAVLLPGPRAAIADLLGIGAVRVSLVADLTPVVTVEVPAGAATDLQEAKAAVDFPVVVPGGDVPDVVLVNDEV